MVRNVNKPYHIVIFLYVITFLCTQVLAIIENGTYCRKMVTKVCCSVSGYKLDHLAINSTTAMAGKAGSTLASAATTVVELVSAQGNVGSTQNGTELGLNHVDIYFVSTCRYRFKVLLGLLTKCGQGNGGVEKQKSKQNPNARNFESRREDFECVKLTSSFY